MEELIPSDLSAKERDILAGLLAEIDASEFENYMQEAQEHLREGKETYTESPEIICLEHIEAIWNCLLEIENDWDKFNHDEQRLLCAAIRYFTRSYDEIPDFETEIGFDDDIAVLNACLRRVGRFDLCV